MSEPTGGTAPAHPDPRLLCEVQHFLHREARLLDREAYREWLDLLTDDVHYWVPGIQYRGRADPEGRHAPDRMAYFDDTKQTLAARVDRLTADTAWSENPPTRHLHLIGNIEVYPAPPGAPGHLTVHSVFTNHRGQWEDDAAVVLGRREDLLRRGPDGGLLLARRAVYLQHALLPAKNINTFF
ncbi:hypothetical protein ACZ90_11535 [Streptomyces albus subsp. albus]|nr:hypothetical protein ACZ90_11535 [Streptomyces albus subsp. albus]